MGSRARQAVAVLTGVLLGSAWLWETPAPASAGGPTSVIMVSPDDGRATALHTTDARYEQLVTAVGAYQPPTGPTTPPTGVTRCAGCEIRLTWLIHDMQVWRIDRVHLSSDDGIWLESVADETGADVLERSGVWQRPPDPEALAALLGEVGLTSEAPVSASDGGPDEQTAVAGAGTGAPVGLVAAVAAVCGLGGVAVGALLGRHRRQADPTDRVLLSG